MNHIDEGALRRMIDDPLAGSTAEREHLTACAACATKQKDIERDRQGVAAVFTLPLPRSDLGAARSKIQASVAGSRPARRLPWSASRPRGFPVVGWAAAGALALGLVVGFTPAANVFTIFQPSQFTTIPVTAAQLRTLPNLTRYGYVHTHHELQGMQYDSLSAVESASGAHVLVARWIPRGVSAQRTFQLVPAQTSSFTFSAAKARQVARRLHRVLQPMPGDIDGTTLSLVTHPAVMSFYGPIHGLPQLVIGQTAMPKITSSGASLAAVEHYILHLPGVSPRLAQEIESIGKPTTTLPIPIPVTWAFAQHVRVQGHPGLLVGDNTGIASVVIWQAGGVVHGVAGSLTQGQVMRVAESLG
jgi:hypothetical protein